MNAAGSREALNTQATEAASLLPFEAAPKTLPRKPTGVPTIRALIGALLNPGGARPDDIAMIPWFLTPAVSGAAFALLFLQTGLDRLDAGTATPIGVGLLVVVGLIYGTLGVASLALVAWIGLSIGGSRATPQDVVRAFGLAYSPTFVSVVLGFATHLLFGWRTAIAFGATGVLWALGPINNLLRRMSGGKRVLSLILASVCGALLLLGWGLLGGL